MLLQLLVYIVVGVHKARKIAKEFGLPIVGVHHMEAHALVSRYLTHVPHYFVQFRLAKSCVSEQNMFKHSSDTEFDISSLAYF